MRKILATFTANEDTIAILPAKQIEFGSIVLQTDKILYVAQTPIEIIKATCIKYNSTYEGRRQAIISNTHIKRKVPIPICDLLGIYAFPTHATNNMDCCWFFYNNIIRFYKHPNKERTNVIIRFINQSSLNLDISIYTFDAQMARTHFIKERLVYME